MDERAQPRVLVRPVPATWQGGGRGRERWKGAAERSCAETGRLGGERAVGKAYGGRRLSYASAAKRRTVAEPKISSRAVRPTTSRLPSRKGYGPRLPAHSPPGAADERSLARRRSQSRVREGHGRRESARRWGGESAPWRAAGRSGAAAPRPSVFHRPHSGAMESGPSPTGGRGGRRST